MGQPLRIPNFLNSGRKLHIMVKKQDLQFIKFGSVVIWIHRNDIWVNSQVRAILSMSKVTSH